MRLVSGLEFKCSKFGRLSLWTTRILTCLSHSQLLWANARISAALRVPSTTTEGIPYFTDSFTAFSASRPPSTTTVTTGTPKPNSKKRRGHTLKWFKICTGKVILFSEEGSQWSSYSIFSFPCESLCNPTSFLFLCFTPLQEPIAHTALAHLP